MPPPHSLCLSPPSPSLPTIQTASLSLKPSTPASSPLPPLPVNFTIPTHLKEKILSLEVMGIDSGRALALNPALRDVTPHAVNAVISYLLSNGIHHKDLPRILGMCPRILTSSIRDDLIPVFTFLSKDLRIPDARFRHAIKKCPRLLASSVRDQLKPALIYLQRLGFNDTDALAYQDPILLVSSVEGTLVPKLGFLMGLGLERDQAVEMVLRCPSLFTFNIEKNFRPKYEYLVEEMVGGLDEMMEFPQYFGFSLEKRIKPRFREMVESGVRLPLSVMLKSTEEEFKELLLKEKKVEM